MKNKIKSKPLKKKGIVGKLMSRFIKSGRKVKPARVVSKKVKKLTKKVAKVTKKAKVVQKASRKIVRKAVKKAPKILKKQKKVARKIVKKVSKKIVKKLVKKTSKKNIRKLVKKPLKKVVRPKKAAASKKVKKLLKKVAAKIPKKAAAHLAVAGAVSVGAGEKTAASPLSEAQQFSHEPVLVQEVLQYLELSEKKVVVDGTLGLGGHSKLMLERMPAEGKLIGFDVDDDNMAVARRNLASFGDRAVFVRSNFSNLQEELKNLGIKGVDAILLDLGLSSPQVDNPEKGFSFMREGALDMRFDKNESLTAAVVINTYSIAELMRIFFEYGEERFARKIATEIGRLRKTRSFKTTTELANFIEKLIGRQGHIHPATRVFQALRIEVNHELDVLSSTLKQSVEVLKKHGRLAVIAYHSLEDRVVKQYFRECAREYINEPDKLTTTELEPTLRIITKKPVVPTDAEIIKNPRSRSAKLRVAEKI